MDLSSIKIAPARSDEEVEIWEKQRSPVMDND